MRVKRVFLLAATCVLASGCEFNPESDAAFLCKERLRENLRDPQGARFENRTVTAVGSYGYNITWEVTARNGFGGTSRETMRCSVQYSGDPDWDTPYRVYG